jgi:hypothetical protein
VIRIRQALPALSIAILISWTLFFTACFTWSHGISPINPRHGSRVSSGPLVLEWKPVSPEGAEQVRYQLVIYGKTDDPMYHASDLMETRHVVNMNLSPGNYRWSVRPFYLRNGQWEGGKWNQRKYFWFAVVVFGWGGSLYEFQLPYAIHQPTNYPETASIEENSGQRGGTSGLQAQPLNSPSVDSLEVPKKPDEELVKYVKPASSSETLVSKYGFVQVGFDPMVWERAPRFPQSSPDTEFTLKHATGGAWALIITESTPMSIAALRHALLLNAQRSAPGAKIVFEEDRIVNGTRILCVEMALAPDQIPYTFFGYYWAGDEGAVQFITYAERHLFPRFKDDANALLNGLMITGKH